MRLMAGVAGHVAHVFGSDHLWEVLRFGGVFFVATAAKFGNIRQLGLEHSRIAGMLGLRSVTGLAGDMRMPTGGPDLRLVVMASNAGVLAGKRHGALPDHFERARAIVAVLAERPGDHRLAQKQKSSHGCDEYDHEAH